MTRGVAMVLLITGWSLAVCPARGSVFAQASGGLKIEDALEMSLEELVTVNIATGTPRRVSEVPAITTVITADEIRAMSATDLDQVLETVPGMHVSRTHVSNSPRYVMRGLYSEDSPYVLILINGIPMTLFFTGNIGEFWGGLPVEAIARIEVIRGPGSAVFGADAVGGVVNIVTKSASEIGGTEAGVRVGSLDTEEAWVLHGERYGELDLAMSLQWGSTDGIDKIIEADTQTALDNLLGTSVSEAPGPLSTGRDAFDAHLDLLRGDWRLRLGYQNRDDLGVGAGITQILDAAGGTDRERWTGDLTYRPSGLGEHWDLTLRLAHLSEETLTSTFLVRPGALIGPVFFPQGNFIEFGNDESHLYADLAAVYSGRDGHRLRLGGGYRRVEVDGIVNRVTSSDAGTPFPEGPRDISDDPFEVFGLPNRRSIRFVSAQDEWRINEQLDLTVGVRWDDYSDFGTTLNPRLALLYKPMQKVVVKLLYGRAFRPPHYSEQFLINNAEVLGNPDLDPEIIDTLEVGCSHQWSPSLRFGINAFYYQLDDIILRSTTRPAIFGNRGRRTGHGFELEGDWRPSERLRVWGNVAIQDATEDSTGQRVGHAPGQQLQLQADWKLRHNWRLGASLLWVADRPRVAGDPRPDIDDDLTVDVSLRRQRIAGRVELALMVRNLFDEDVREPSVFAAGPVAAFVRDDLPQAGRTVFAELRVRF